ncbi:hypothetical protein ACJMK2_035783 [Sinanodonta woodiana]|uniref:HMG box domain-containing protein n=1 Tax=Sinanodonta woodiana TaxID=1069815 RepID=A0ABD3WGB8_SINWO
MVIQMQRIISYECFLENTVLYLCHELGLNPRQLNLGTHLITDKIKDYRMPDFIVNSQEEVSENVNPSPQRSLSDACCIDLNRREKISSPTVDSTTGNTYATATLRHMMSFVPSCYSQSTECSQDSMVPTQSFIPISRPLRVDLHDSQEEADEVIDFLHGEIESFFNPTINEESAKPDFMHDDLAPTSTIDENSSFNGFDLSSPDRSVGKVFLQSPKNMNLHRHGDVEGSEAMESKELTSISPESILETKPREKFFLNSAHCIAPSMGNTTVESALQSTDRQSGIITIHSNSDCNQGFKSSAQSKHPCYISSERRNNSESEEELKTETRPPWGKENMYHCTVNKRKCFVPRRAPFHIISGNSNKSFKKRLGSEKFQTVSADESERKDDDDDYDDDDDTDEEIDDDLNHFPRNEKSAEMKANVKVDHRRTTWMNGFMMFSQLNRRKFIGANPGVHTSHISKMMGHVWRNMTAEEQKPYK